MEILDIEKLVMGYLVTGFGLAPELVKNFTIICPDIPGTDSHLTKITIDHKEFSCLESWFMQKLHIHQERGSSSFGNK